MPSSGRAPHCLVNSLTDGHSSRVLAYEFSGLNTLPSKADISPGHFQERHIADRRAGFGFEDISQI